VLMMKNSTGIGVTEDMVKGKCPSSRLNATLEPW
jgi:hypothetical protein